jgi:hypothetical protein
VAVVDERFSPELFVPAPVPPLTTLGMLVTQMIENDSTLLQYLADLGEEGARAA